MLLFQCLSRYSAWRERLAIAALLTCLVGFPPSVEAFKTFKIAGGNIHEQITRQALLSPVVGLQPKAFALVDKGNTDQDLPPNILIDTHHFDNCKLDESRAFIQKCYGQITTDAVSAAQSKSKRKHILLMFGALLHPIQDFCSHSNYVEMKLRESSSLTPETIPLVNWSDVKNSSISATASSIRTGFFTALEVSGSRPLAIARLKSQKMLIPATDYLNSTEYNKLRSFDDRIAAMTNSKFSFLHNDLNKDSAQTNEGKTAVPTSGILLYEYARTLAVRETQRQWQKLEAIVRAASPTEANSLISLLKKGL